MDSKEKNLREEFTNLQTKLQDSAIYGSKDYPALARRQAELQQIISLFDEKKQLESQVEQTKHMVSLNDAELAELAKTEQAELEAKIIENEEKLTEVLLPKDPNDERDAIVEIRAAAGGDEASLFAGDLYRMYVRWCERKGLKTELVSESPSEAGGFKEIIFAVRGENAYQQLKFEAGVHRVQRVPVTESSGRIHTSTVTVAVLPEAEEADIEIKPEETRVDVFRSSGPGGQSVNTTDSAVRITHLPTATVVTCQDERSQLKNKNKAMRVLRTRILDKMRQEELLKASRERKAQIGSAERSEKIRTYNSPDRRVTDHRIGLTLHKLENILEGELDDFIDGLIAEDAKRRLAAT